jgi:N-acetylneuraminate lyase
MQNIRGVYAAIVTPLAQDGSLDTAALRRLVKRELDRGVEGFYCCGSSGEGLLLETDERKKVVELVVGEAAGAVPVIVHTGSLSTGATIQLSRHAQAQGAAAVSLIPPIYYNYTAREVFEHYAAVVDAVDIGVIVYNIPQFTGGISFTKKGSSSLLEAKRIIGIKHTSMNLYELERIRDAYPAKILFNGFDEIYLYSLMAGADATIGTTVNLCPALFKAIRSAAGEGRIDDARRLQTRLNAFIEALVDASIFPATKYALGVLGVECGPCRRPFIDLDEEKRAEVRAALDGIAEFL